MSQHPKLWLASAAGDSFISLFSGGYLNLLYKIIFIAQSFLPILRQSS